LKVAKSSTFVNTGKFGGRPSLTFSVSHLADGNLSLSLLIDS